MHFNTAVFHDKDSEVNSLMEHYSYDNEENFEFQLELTQKRFKDCKNLKPLPFDFYLPLLNVCIEYDGIQHFIVNEHFDGVQGLIDRQRNDDIKTNYCKSNNIHLLRISYKDNIEEKLISFLCNEIK